MAQLRYVLGVLALALALSVGSTRQRQAAFARSSQRGTLRVETTADGARRALATLRSTAALFSRRF